MPPLAKDPSVRARRNKTTTKAKLKRPENPQIPELPELPEGEAWRPQVRAWWNRGWASPMRSEWDASDVDLLYVAAKLWQEFWNPAISARDAKQLAGEIRLIEMQCGKTPMARRTLQWELPDDDDDQSSSKPAKKAPAKKAPQKRPDPRETRKANLSVVV